MSTDILQAHALNAPDVCSNCFRRVRVERPFRESRDPTEPTSVRRSAYTRTDPTTEVEAVPYGPPADATEVWCECGVASAYERVWDDGDDRCLTMTRFKTLLRRCIESLEAKGVTLSRRPAVHIAVGRYRDEHDVNDALAAGIDAGVQHSTATDRRSTTAPLAE